MDSKERRKVGAKAPLAMLMVDIDHFKIFNDAMGHVAGDACLRRVAEALRDNLHRSTDFVARFGGEEFVVVLRDTGLEGAVAVGERLRAAIEGLRIAHPARKDGLTVATISVGAASTETMPDSVANIELLAAADQALYEAKGAGRNRVWAQTPTA
jgi:diguanylate cyclase (GGDEF)-like protein